MTVKSRQHPLYFMKFVAFIAVYLVCHDVLGDASWLSLIAAWLSAGIVGVHLAHEVDRACVDAES